MSEISSKNNEKKPSGWAFLLNNILYPSALIYLILTLLCSALTQFVPSTGFPVLSLAGIGTILLFSVCLALANRLFYIKKLSAFARTVLHFLCFIALIAVVMTLTGYIKSGGAFLVILMIAALYIIVAVPCLIVYSVKHKKANEDSAYKNRFAK